MYNKEAKQKMNQLAKNIIDRKNNETRAATYKDVPDLKEIELMLNEGYEIELDTLKFAYNAYLFLVEQYHSLTRFSVSAKLNERALRCAYELSKLDKTPRFAVEVFGELLRDRNFFVDDDCIDVLDLALKFLPEGLIKRIHEERLNHRRNLKNDPVEMSEAYLAIIDEVEEKIAKNMTTKGMGSCFEYWELKERYLLEHNIVWTSPALLNPRVRFD